MSEESTFTEKAANAMSYLSDLDLSPAEELEVAIGLTGGLLEFHSDVLEQIASGEETEESAEAWAVDATRLTVALENLAAVDLGEAED